MDISIFPDKTNKPGPEELQRALGKTYVLWQRIIDLVYLKYPSAISEWNFPGPKYGWSLKMKDKKRAIVYLLPRDKFFMVAFNFGQKAFETLMDSNISEDIKHSLESARVYAEGRGIRMEVQYKKQLKDINQLIDIKLSF